MALKKSQKSLKSWTGQKWMTSGTHASKQYKAKGGGYKD